ncbi:SUMF1/EgtB/PvdO family nonheme iron enzyme [Halosquirtibacter xylanolyticus]|uniref:SUMF1/EgtB/PvdO family nonheme iron enzyme n=1 Tax=Halosquirtibacter xylanolyticus TaxID=3374599 RepID=UPI003749D5CC|nr:SUMF1/EgtB/PvdO family nonheme iron enzyme [Prolixibacteraceae bacterium]
MCKIKLTTILLIFIVPCLTTLGQSNKSWSEYVITTKKRLQNNAIKPWTYKSGPIKKNKPPKKIKIDIHNRHKIVLKNNANTDLLLGNAKLVTKNGKEIFIDQLNINVGYKSKVYLNENRKYKTPKINKTTFSHSIVILERGYFELVLDNKYSFFVADIGIEKSSPRKTNVTSLEVTNISVSDEMVNLYRHFPKETDNLMNYFNHDPSYWLFNNCLDDYKEICNRLVNKLTKKNLFKKKLHNIEQSSIEEQEKQYLNLFTRIMSVFKLEEELRIVNLEAIELAIINMSQYDQFNTEQANKDLLFIKKHLESTKKNIYFEDQKVIAIANQILQRKRRILLANPLLDMDKVIVVTHHLKGNSRRVMAREIGTPFKNSAGNGYMHRTGYDCEISELYDLGGTVQNRTILNLNNTSPITDLQLHWDAKRILYSAVNKNMRWQLYEVNIDGSNNHKVTHVDEPDIDFFDATYLPSGKIITASTIGYQGVPCNSGSVPVANLCLYDPKTNDLRRLNFGQDNDWSPEVMNNGQIMYLRWEYTDNTHYFSRIMMRMNPDGTTKKELYGSGSFWPNTMFDAKPIPNGDSQFVAVVSGHHGVPRTGRLVLFDPTKGRQEEKGVIQEIPYRNKPVKPVIGDKIVDGVWPQFLKPHPLNDKYFLVTAKLSPDGLWGLYLVDVFDNITPISVVEGKAITEVIPVLKRDTPPIIPEKVDVKSKESTVFIQDIYEGLGTQGVPRGTIKGLRILAYEFAYNDVKSNFDAHGIQSCWDIKRLLGTVPVEKDGSVMFKIPANVPISIQPLDENGAAVQLMRSWLTGMPNEIVSCIGCHENQNSIAIPKNTIASQLSPKIITPPNGGVRPFSFEYEIQPILNKRCIACHDGSQDIPDYKDTSIDNVVHFGKSYLALHPYINRQGAEADIHTMNPMEYHANTSELVKLLKKGHHNVTLSDKEWRTLFTWIDFNAPYNGSFQTCKYNGVDQYKRRQELMSKYNNISVDWQEETEKYIEYLSSLEKDSIVVPPPLKKKKNHRSHIRHWPFNSTEAQKKQESYSSNMQEIEIAPGVKMNFVLIPQGNFVMGSDDGDQDESPMSVVKIKKPFWMGQFEVTNEQFKTFFPNHDSRFIAQLWKDHTTAGYSANKPNQPVIRVSWKEAMKFCEILSKKIGKEVTLPTESQWEWAARAGSDRAFWFGNYNSNFEKYANLADKQLRNMAVCGVNPKPMTDDNTKLPYYDFIPRSYSVDDGSMLMVKGGKYEANPWRLYDMNGNVAEWTRTNYANYPYVAKDGRNNLDILKEKVVRGGSWRDRSSKSTSSYRVSYKPWQKVFNVGFRVIIEE